MADSTGCHADRFANEDLEEAEHALEAIHAGSGLLKFSPFCCRKAQRENSLLRELINPFGKSDYVALFEIDDARTVTVLAVRHQRELRQVLAPARSA